MAMSLRLSKFLLGFGLIVLLSLPACTRKHSVQIANVTQTNTVRMVSRYGEFVSGVSLRLTGKLEGTALFFLPNGETQKLSGVIDCKFMQNLSTSSNCVLRYAPQDVKGGKLTVEYQFH
jgi:hypothetical protein